MGRLTVVAGVAALAWAAPAWGQLSSEDIAELHRRARAEGWTFTIGENPATRRPLHELCGLLPWDDTPASQSTEPAGPTRDLPASFDWRSLGCVTPIRDQGQCGSCWAFAAIGVVESAILINEGPGVDLSEQWLVSCTGAGSCSGGTIGSALMYHLCEYPIGDLCGDLGAVLEFDFPYQASDVPCGCPYPHPYCIDDYDGVYSMPSVKQAILDHGPVTAAVAVNSAFQAYTGGVFNACGSVVNHGVVLVGWDDTQGAGGVWILRNSWGTDWGEGGYMRIEYGCMGASASYVLYPSVPDCNSNGILDECELDCQALDGACSDVPGCGTGTDCNLSGVPDECDVARRPERDCNTNGIPDECDVADGTSPDEDGNGVPDECPRRVVYVDQSAPGSGDGSTWDNSYHRLQGALAAAELNQEIRVAGGTYRPDLGGGQTLGDRAATFRILDDILIKGGYAGYGHADPDNRNVRRFKTVLSGDLNRDDESGFINNQENSHHVVTLSSSPMGYPATIDGCTITGGNTEGLSWPDYAAGGIYSTFVDRDVVLRNCTVRLNAGTWGGGLGQCYFGTADGSTTLVNCVVSANMAALGGGMCALGGPAVIAVNSAFIANSAYHYGAVMSELAPTTLINSTISGNAASGTCGGLGINVGDGQALALTGCVLWGNTDSGGADESAQVWIGGGGPDPVNYCCIQGLTGDLGGVGNIGSDPLLRSGGIHLRWQSPCKDAGDPTFSPYSGETDIDGQPRVVDGRVDIGADEVVFDLLTPSAWEPL